MANTNQSRQPQRAAQAEPEYWSDFDPHIKVVDLAGKPPLTAPIVRVSSVAVYDKKAQAALRKPTIYVRGQAKYFILSPTNRQMLVQAFGNNRNDCLGKLVTLAVVNIEAFGKRQDVVRISIPRQVNQATGELAGDDQAAAEPEFDDDSGAAEAAASEPQTPGQQAVAVQATQSVPPPASPAPAAHSPSQSQPAPRPGTTSPKTNGKPRDPATVKEALRVFASKTTGTPTAGAGLIKQTAIALNALVVGNEKRRHTLTSWLFGKVSANDLSTGECLALLQWIGLSKEGEQFVPTAMAIEEANAILAVAQTETAVAGK